MMRRENAGQTIQATALVHEAYMKLIRCSKGWESEAHFMNAAALKMREIMLDRRKNVSVTVGLLYCSVACMELRR